MEASVIDPVLSEWGLIVLACVLLIGEMIHMKNLVLGIDSGQ